MQIYSVEVARSIAEIEKMRHSWESMQYHPNADIDYFTMILDSRKKILRPHVIQISKKGIPQALWVGRLEEHSIDLKLGYLTILRLNVRAITIIYGGILGNMSEEICHVCLKEIQRALKQGEADVAYINYLDTKSILYNIIKTERSMYKTDNVIILNAHWKMILPEKRSGLFEKMNSKHRAWLKRLPRVLEREKQNRVDYKVFRKEIDVDQLCIDAEKIASKTYQRAIGAGFIDDNEHRRRMQLSAEKGWLFAYIMYIDKKPCAFWIGDIYKGTCYLHFTGYDSEYKKYEIGTILLTRMVEDLFETYEEVREIDFGFGDALYKQKICNVNWQETPVYILAPTIKASSINCFRNVNNIILSLIEKVIAKYNIREKLKRKWREQLLRKRQKGKDE